MSLRCTDEIAAEAAGQIVQSRYSHEDHFTVLTTNIIKSAIEKGINEAFQQQAKTGRTPTQTSSMKERP